MSHNNLETLGSPFKPYLSKYKTIVGDFSLHVQRRVFDLDWTKNQYEKFHCYNYYYFYNKSWGPECLTFPYR